jgi:hypothetical protein
MLVIGVATAVFALADDPTSEPEPIFGVPIEIRCDAGIEIEGCP